MLNRRVLRLPRVPGYLDRYILNLVYFNSSTKFSSTTSLERYSNTTRVQLYLGTTTSSVVQL